MRARCVVDAWNPSVHRYSSSNQRWSDFSDRVGQIVAQTLPSMARRASFDKERAGQRSASTMASAPLPANRTQNATRGACHKRPHPAHGTS
jgi:hypothetical protein